MNSTNVHPVFNDLQAVFKTKPNEIAIIDKDEQTYSFSDFEQYIAGAYAILSERNIKKGDKILVAVPMSMQLYAILEAIFAIGATAIFLDPWMKGKKMGSIINQVQPDLFIVTKKLSRITWLLPATWKLKKWKVNKLILSNKTYPIAKIKDTDNALITFTSGTSGEPKGANRTFAFLLAQAETLKAHLKKSNTQSIDYTNFPIVGLANFALGNTVAIPQLNLMKIHQSDPKEIVTQLTKQRVNRLVVSPSLLKKVLAAIGKESSIKTILTGGAPISISLVKKALKTCPSIYFEGIYGSTEAEPICIAPFSEINKNLNQPLKGVYVGKPVAEITIKIIKSVKKNISTATFSSLELPDNEPGEVVVTGAHVNKNYYKNKPAFEKNKIIDAEGEIWHRTGDIGYFENGFLFLVGRDHRIMTKNEKVYYPYPLEQLLEIEFNLDDLGYIQKNNGKFYLYYYSEKNINSATIKTVIEKNNYPINEVIHLAKPLPRDARHKSKLLVEQL